MKPHFIRISLDDLIQPQILSSKLSEASLLGFFYLEIPPACKQHIDEALEVAHSFSKNPSYRRLRRKGYSHKSENEQIESLLIEKQDWDKHLPYRLVSLAHMMNTLGLYLLKKVLEGYQIPEELWEIATGSVVENKGQVYFVFNRYRSGNTQETIQIHQDAGQIGVLFIPQPGLEAKINEEWIPIDPLPHHFVVNFGRALEIFVNNPQQLIAPWHRVRQVSKDCVSFGVFLNNNIDGIVSWEKCQEAVKTKDHAWIHNPVCL